MAKKETVTSADIIIVGGGIIGCALAAALTTSSYNIVVLDAAKIAAGTQPANVDHVATDKSSGEAIKLTDFDNRVSTLTPTSVDFLKGIEVWQGCPKWRHSTFHQMTVWDAKGSGEVHFDAAMRGQKQLGWVVENCWITKALQARLQQAKNVQLVGENPVTGLHLDINSKGGNLRHQVVTESGDIFEGALIVAADGSHSPIRTLAALPTRQWDYQQQALVATVETTACHEHTAWQIFTHEGPLALLPLWGESATYTSLVWSVSKSYAQRLMALTDDNFATTLQHTFEQRLGQVNKVARRAMFPLRQCHATRYARPGLVVVGDAAHTFHPLAGQGVNMGLLDVSALAEVLWTAGMHGSSLGDMTHLRIYEKRRRYHNLMMMGIMEGFYRGFQPHHPFFHWLRNKGFKQFDKTLLLKKLVMNCMA